MDVTSQKATFLATNIDISKIHVLSINLCFLKICKLAKQTQNLFNNINFGKYSEFYGNKKDLEKENSSQPS